MTKPKRGVQLTRLARLADAIQQAETVRPTPEPERWCRCHPPVFDKLYMGEWWTCRTCGLFVDPDRAEKLRAAASQ